MNKVLHVLAIGVAFAMGTGVCSAMDLSSFPKPRTIETHNASGAVILWDATAYIEKFLALNTSSQDALSALKYEAVKIFVNRAPGIAASEKHLHLVVAFAQTGAFNERYQTKTFEGIQYLLTVDGSLHKGMSFSKDWDSQAQRGVYPRGLRLHLMGDIPQEQQ